MEANARQYPEIKAEMEAIELALENYALSRQIQPSAGNFEKILQKIDNKKPDSYPTSSNSTSRWPLVLSLLLLVAIAWGIYQFFKNLNLEQEKQIVQTQLDNLQADCDEQRRQLNDLQIQLDIIRAQGNQPIIMKGNLNEEEIIATVHWNTEEGASYLDLVNWPAPPEGQQYQLWAIIEGQPTDMDPIALDLTEGSFVQVDHLDTAQAFAVSLEPEGGSPSPTNVLMISFVPGAQG